LFSEKEKLVLELTEKVTLIAQKHIDVDLYNRLAKYFTPEDFENVLYTFELNGSILENNDISGNPKLYQKLQTLYENDHKNIVKVNQDVLKEYNNVLIRNLTIYGVVATIVTFLLFFLKPIVELMNKKKNNQETKE